MGALFIGLALIALSPPFAGADATPRLEAEGTAEALARPEAPPAEEAVEPAPVVPTAYLGTIVIDPGHGGHDAGAIGPGGTLEKDVNLALSLRLVEKLKETTRARVLLTRSTDEFITLEGRTEFANSVKADIFISVHANASRRRGADGIEAYFLSFEASDDEARKTAAFENNVVSLDGVVEDAPQEDLKAILWDLTQTEAHHESSRLAEAVYSRLIIAAGSEPRGVKQAPFRVLVGAAMPAVLVEVGFISNPEEERRLKSDDVQDRLAEAINHGVVDFGELLSKRVGAYAGERTNAKN